MYRFYRRSRNLRCEILSFVYACFVSFARSFCSLFSVLFLTLSVSVLPFNYPFRSVAYFMVSGQARRLNACNVYGEPYSTFNTSLLFLSVSLYVHPQANFLFPSFFSCQHVDQAKLSLPVRWFAPIIIFSRYTQTNQTHRDNFQFSFTVSFSAWAHNLERIGKRKKKKRNFYFFIFSLLLELRALCSPLTSSVAR